MRYDWIAKHKAVFCVEVMCKVLGVSTSGYYGHLQGKPSQRVRRHEQIKPTCSAYTTNTTASTAAGKSPM